MHNPLCLFTKNSVMLLLIIKFSFLQNDDGGGDDGDGGGGGGGDDDDDKRINQRRLPSINCYISLKNIVGVVNSNIVYLHRLSNQSNFIISIRTAVF
jgi:hypothetical protein